MAMPPEAASRLCAPSALAPASRFPPTVSAATGAARSPATKPNVTSTRAAASWPASEVAVQGAPRRVQPVAIARTMPGRAPLANWSMKFGAVALPPGSATRADPLAGQLHDQPLSPRTHAACSGTGTPASSQVAATKPAPSSRR